MLELVTLYQRYAACLQALAHQHHAIQGQYMALQAENQSLLKQNSDLLAARDAARAQVQNLEAFITKLTDQLDQVGVQV
jgi:chromosome segregation ATPase